MHAGVMFSWMNFGTFNKICTLTSPVTAARLRTDSRLHQVSFNGTTIADARTAIDAAAFIFANYDVTETAGAVTGVTLVDASGDALLPETDHIRSRLVQLDTTINSSRYNRLS